MKKILFIYTLLSTLFIYSQNRPYKIGDEVEYFDGVNWVESKILQVESSRCLVYLNNNMSKTKWFINDDIRLLYPDKIYEIEQKKDSIICKYKVGDIVSIKIDKKIVSSEVLKVNTQNLTYLIYVNEAKTSVRWVDEKILTKQNEKPIINEVKVNVETINNDKIITYSKGDKVLYKENDEWIETEIIDIRDNQIQIFSNKEKTMTKWVDKTEITK